MTWIAGRAPINIEFVPSLYGGSPQWLEVRCGAWLIAKIENHEDDGLQPIWEIIIPGPESYSLKETFPKYGDAADWFVKTHIGLGES